MRIRVVFCILLGLCSCSQSPHEEDSSKPHELALLYNLSGYEAALDVPALKGTELAFKLLSKKYPKIADELGYVVINSHSHLQEVQEDAKRVAEDSKTAALMGFCNTDMVLAAAPMADKQQKLFITPGATSPQLPQQDHNVYLAAFGDNAQAAASAEYAHDHLGYRSVCILYDQEMESTLLLSKYFKESFASYGGTILSEIGFPHLPPSISQQLDALQSLSRTPDFIYLAAGPREALSLIKEIRHRGLTQPIFGGDSFDTPQLVQSDTGLNDIYFTTHVMLDLQTTDPIVNDFINAYMETYQEFPKSAFSALGFDAANLFFEAISRSASYQTEDLMKAMDSIHNFGGVTGTISYLDGSHIPVKPVTLIVIKKDRRVFVASFIPQKVPSP